MDIEISPGADFQRSVAQPRDNWGLAADIQAGSDGGMIGKRVCSVRHPAPLRRESRFIEKRMKGILWRHSSFNLVEPRSFALGAAGILRQKPEKRNRGSIAESPLQHLPSGS